MDELYVIARRVLLDAVEALGDHRHATVLVGAQAVYLHTGAADLGIVEHTTDADLAIDPRLLAEIPPLERALAAAGFRSSASHVGVWKTRRETLQHVQIDVQVDLLVPSSVSPGTGRRSARLSGHDAGAARKVDGLEGALVNHAEWLITSLEPKIDPREVRLKVAGPGALLVAKMFKIHERKGTSRASDKDALDVFRLLRALDTQELAAHMRVVQADAHSAESAKTALATFVRLFGNRAGEGAAMAARAAQPVLDADEVRLACEFLAGDLLAALK